MHLCWCELWSVSCNISFTHSFTFTVCLHYIIPIGTKKLKCRVGGNYFDVIITLLRVYFFTSSSEKWNIYMRIYITYNILWGLLMIWLDLILLSFLWSIICWYMRFEGWGEYQLLWGSLKSSSRPPLLPEFSQWSPFLGWGRFAFLYCSSCPYYQDIVSSSLRELWLPFLWLGVLLLPVVPSFRIASSVTLDLGFHLSRSILLHPLLGMWGHKTLQNTHSILQ